MQKDFTTEGTAGDSSQTLRDVGRAREWAEREVRGHQEGGGRRDRVAAVADGEQRRPQLEQQQRSSARPRAAAIRQHVLPANHPASHKKHLH